MKSKILASVAIGLVIGLVASSSLRQSEAQGQAEEKRREWEYKVVAFVVDLGRENRNVDGHQQRIEKLAAEGWEYVGLLAAGSNTDMSFRLNNQLTVTSGGNVLFKRLKR
jgi:hypothetical protein